MTNGDRVEAIGEPWVQRTSRQSFGYLLVRYSLFLALVDLLIGFVSYLSAWGVRMVMPLPFTLDLLPAQAWFNVTHPWVLLIICQIFTLFIFGLYDDLRNLRNREIVVFSLFAVSLQVVAVSSYLYFASPTTVAPGLLYPRSIVLVFGFFNWILLLLWRLVIKAQIRKQVLRVVVVSDSLCDAQGVVKEIRKSPWMGFQLLGIVVQNPDRSGGQTDVPILGSLGEIEEVVERLGVEQLIFASQEGWKDQALNSLSRLQEEGRLRIAILPSVFEIVIGRLRHINLHDAPLIEVRRNPNEPFERLVKRVFDLTLSLYLIVLLSPLFTLIAVVIRTLDKGPVFYLQERVGLGGRAFSLIKFRTMVPYAEQESGAVFSSQNDPRVTGVGRLLRRFRLDELPQLLNVLRGDMSFIGPRPERPIFVNDLERDLPGYRERHKIKPGITGLAQVRSYYDTAPSNKLKFDLAYIYNYSFSLDLLILLETIKVMLIRRGS